MRGEARSRVRLDEWKGEAGIIARAAVAVFLNNDLSSVRIAFAPFDKNPDFRTPSSVKFDGSKMHPGILEGFSANPLPRTNGALPRGCFQNVGKSKEERA